MNLTLHLVAGISKPTSIMIYVFYSMRAKPLSLVNELAHEGNDLDENMLSLGAASKSSSCSSSFLLSRRLFSQLGLNGWEKRSNIQLLHKDEKLLRELKHLDAQVKTCIYFIFMVLISKSKSFVSCVIEMS